MKQAIPPYLRFTALTGVALLCGFLTTASWSQAHAVGTWSYPQSEAERVKRENMLESKLASQEGNYEAQHKVLLKQKKELADLEARIEVAEGNLDFKKEPLTEAIEKYRQAQNLSLLDPMVSTEPQRLELIEVKQETSAVVQEYEEKLQELMEQLPQAESGIDVAKEQLKDILRDIDSLMKHRDAIRELVFVRNVAD